MSFSSLSITSFLYLNDNKKPRAWRSRGKNKCRSFHIMTR
nr:MAG TPA: hypothetical protein [Caudoviricetes sp.]